MDIYTIADCAREAFVTRATVWKWVKYGYKGIVLTAHHIGHNYYIHPADWQTFKEKVGAE